MEVQFLPGALGVSDTNPGFFRENLVFSTETEFMPETPSAQNKSVQTFSIILPNLIHNSRKNNLKK